MEIIINAFLGAAGAGLLTLLVMAIKWFAKKIAADNLTMKALAHDAYFRQCREMLVQDAISEEDLENHNYLYSAYHAQKLNGTGDKLHEEVLKMKVVVRVSDDFASRLP